MPCLKCGPMANRVLLAKGGDEVAGGDGVGIGGDSVSTSVEIEILVEALDQFKTERSARNEFE